MIEQIVDKLKITENEYTNTVLDKDGLVFARSIGEDNTSGECGIKGGKYDVKNYNCELSAQADDNIVRSIKRVGIQTDLSNINEDFIIIGQERIHGDSNYSSSSKYFGNKIKNSGLTVFDSTAYSYNGVIQSNETYEIDGNVSDVFHVLISSEVTSPVVSIRIMNVGEPLHYSKEIYVTNMSPDVKQINLINFGDKKNTKNFVYNIKYTNRIEYRSIFRGSINGDSGAYAYYKINEF